MSGDFILHSPQRRGDGVAAAMRRPGPLRHPLGRLGRSSATDAASTDRATCSPGGSRQLGPVAAALPHHRKRRLLTHARHESTGIDAPAGASSLGRTDVDLRVEAAVGGVAQQHVHAWRAEPRCDASGRSGRANTVPRAQSSSASGTLAPRLALAAPARYPAVDQP